MSKDSKIVEGLREAVAHAKGEDNECRVSVVHVPNTPASRPDVEAIKVWVADMRYDRYWRSTMLTLIAYIDRLEDTVKKETAVITNFMARVNPTFLAAADDQQYVVAIHAIENLEALADLEPDNE